MNPEDLNKFCAPDSDPREWLKTPFRVGDDLVASNGIILASLDGMGGPEYKEKDSESVGRVLDLARSTETRACFAADYSTPEACRACSGSGVVQVKGCPECDGDGEVDAETDYSTYRDLECRSCQGEGVIKGEGDETECFSCCGNGTEPLTDFVWLNDFPCPIERRYWQLVADLPGVEIGLHDQMTIAFRFDGGAGAIMCIHNPRRERGAA